MDTEIKLSLRLNTKPVWLKWKLYGLATYIVFELWEFCTLLKPS